jgi:branched-chain amino acid aminotransferase group I
MEKIVYLNGALLPLSEAKISVLDYGFLFGYGLFETMRAYNGKIFRLESHLERLQKSAEKLDIPANVQAWKNAVNHTLQANGLKEARVRLTLSIGQGSPVPDPRTCISPTVLVIVAEYHPYPPEIYRGGFRVVISSFRRNSQSPIPGMKTANFLESLLSRQEARAAGADDALLLNDKGFLAEASSSNVFTVSQGVLRTPRLDCGILPGVTRGVILELAAGLNYVAQETDISPAELVNADEAFITSSMIEIMPLAAVDGRPIRSGEQGIITKNLMRAYGALLLQETS